MVEGRVTMAGAVHADLVDRLGRDRVAMGEAARRMAGFDPQGREGPVAVVRPSNAEQVEHVLRIGRLRHLPVEVRSRLPALLPDDLRDTLTLDTSGLNRPPAIDIGRRVVTVGAGVEAAAVDRATRQARLCLRGLPAEFSGETLGALLAAGEPGELGLGDGSLLSEVVSALVVTGGGRILRLGGSDLLGQGPWLGEGTPDPLSILMASEGRLAVLCEVTLKLHPAPHVAWASADLPLERKHLLAALSAGRAATSARMTDAVLLHEAAGRLRIDVRAATWRGEDDLPLVTERVRAGFRRHEVELHPFKAEESRARLGLQPGEWPRAPKLVGPALDLRVSWPDVAAVLDVSDALYAEAGQAPARQWALGQGYVRLRCLLDGATTSPHPLVLRAAHLLDAGAIPIGTGSRLRQSARDRIPPAVKVLLASLARTWDPDGVLSSKSGLL
jgi:FAD/FMN-containing dehydrogenase